jgi:hypothetical protein
MPVSQSIASPCCPTPATKGVAQCYPVNTTATVPGCCNPKAPKTAAPCCCIGTGTLTFTTAVAPPAKQPSLEDLLEKLEALEAKQAALDEEVKATRALVSLKFKAVVEKVNKLGASNPTTVIGERHPDYRRYVVPPAKHDVSVTPPGVTP